LYEDGRTYSGRFENDKKHGYGVYTWESGKRYEGYWRLGR